MKKKTCKDLAIEFVSAAHAIISSADDIGCDGDLIVVDKKAVKKLDKTMKALVKMGHITITNP